MEWFDEDGKVFIIMELLTGALARAPSRHPTHLPSAAPRPPRARRRPACLRGRGGAAGPHRGERQVLRGAAPPPPPCLPLWRLPRSGAERFRPPPQVDARHAFGQLVGGMTYLHHMGIAHRHGLRASALPAGLSHASHAFRREITQHPLLARRDLKPENFLLKDPRPDRCRFHPAQIFWRRRCRQAKNGRQPTHSRRLTRAPAPLAAR